MITKFHAIVDLDDFAPDAESNALDILVQCKHRYKDFKATLFVILGRWKNRQVLEDIAKFDWIEMAAHGYLHLNNEEVYDWDRKKWYDVINDYEETGYFVKGFKAPNFDMNQLGYHVMQDCGWWVAIRKHQIKDLPKGLKYYSFEKNIFGDHGHTWTLKPDLRDRRFQWTPKTTFEFVSEHIDTK